MAFLPSEGLDVLLCSIIGKVRGRAFTESSHSGGR